jgi:hypothetical protein
MFLHLRLPHCIDLNVGEAWLFGRAYAAFGDWDDILAGRQVFCVFLFLSSRRDAFGFEAAMR